MKMTIAFLALCASALASPCLAQDPPLAGGRLVVADLGQPFCTDLGQLRGVLRASVAHVAYPYAGYPSCMPVPNNTRVEVLEDLTPDSRYMHVVRARVANILGPRDGFTYSVGLYPPVLLAPPPPLPYE
jgi:hypothetical protein